LKNISKIHQNEWILNWFTPNKTFLKAFVKLCASFEFLKD